MDSHFRFTKAKLAATEPTKSGRRYVYDTHTSSLAMCVTPTGVRTFYVVKRVAGRPTRYRLGRFPAMSIENARKAARGVVVKIDAGKDPQADRRLLRGRFTLTDAFEHYRRVHCDAHCSPRTLAEDRRMYDKFLAKWSKRPLDTIARSEVALLHGKIGKAGRIQANRTIQLMSRIYNHADEHLQEGLANPCRRIKLFPEASRERRMDATETRAFLLAVKEEPPLWRDFWLVVALTGSRRGAVQAMEWSQVDLNRGVWLIPAALAKNKTPTSIVLATSVVSILQDRYETVNGSPYVFPAPSKTGYIIEPRKSWLRVLDRAGITDLRPHDLRRSFASVLVDRGANAPLIAKSLGHRSLRSAAPYSRVGLDVVRESVEAATLAMLEAAEADGDGAHN